jgi:hypothetical protein
MRLNINPASPWWVHALAFAALVLHIAAGAIGLLSGTAAIAFRKGSINHARAGRLFVASMLVMAGIGAVVAPLLPQRTSTAAGVITGYLVLSAWLTVRRPPATTGRAEIAALAAGGASIAACLYLIWIGIHAPDGSVDGQPYQPMFIFGAVAALATALDVRAIRSGGLTGIARLSRHLWRMCTALLIASISFFLGQSAIFPHWLANSPVLYLAAAAPLLVLAVWMIRIRIKIRPPAQSAPNVP